MKTTVNPARQQIQAFTFILGQYQGSVRIGRENLEIKNMLKQEFNALVKQGLINVDALAPRFHFLKQL